MIGLVKTSAGAAKMPRPLRTDPSELTLAKLANVLGVRIDPGAPLVPAARTMFPATPEGDAAFERHLDRLGARILAGMANVAPEQCEAPPPKPKKPAIYRDGRRISWLDLRLVSCAGCRRSLLGASDERVRDHARRSRSRLALAQLPPPVAGHVNERPVCANCHTPAANRAPQQPAA
jgi:hypothetical protein